MRYVLAMLSLLALLGVACSGSTKATAAKPHDPGQAATVGGLAVTVYGARSIASQPTDFVKPVAGTEWLTVDVGVENHSGQPFTIDPQAVSALDAQHRNAVHVPAGLSPAATLSGVVPPGQSVRGETSFEVPLGTQVVTVRYTAGTRTADWSLSLSSR